VPDRELVLVHLGKSPEEHRPPLHAAMRRIVAAVPPGIAQAGHCSAEGAGFD